MHKKHEWRLILQEFENVQQLKKFQQFEWL